MVLSRDRPSGGGSRKKSGWSPGFTLMRVGRALTGSSPAPKSRMLQKYLKDSMATTPFSSQDERKRAPEQHDDGVRAMFDRIAPQYDRINRFITGGLDKR